MELALFKTVKKDRRKGKPPIPDDIHAILTIAQKRALKELESFGWVTDYVRRPLFQDPKVVMRDPKTGKQALITEDGTVDHTPMGLAKREDD